MILFANSVSHAKLMAAVLRAREIESYAVTGDTPTSERHRVINRFRSSYESPIFLCNYGVLTTGFDAPNTSAAILARPTKSLVLYSQMIGRALRGPLAGGNEQAEIITVVDMGLPGFGNLTESFYNWEDVWTMSGDQLRFDFVPTALAVKAMRDSGYKNAAYAIAELIDNSLQAGADTVELLCVEAEEQLTHRRVRRIRQVAVLDNGSGMDADVLRLSLQFGNGTHLDDRSGMGRFGMGLPSASISQCKKLEVWTWQSGPDAPLYTCLDLEEIERGTTQEVPQPSICQIPEFWRQAGKAFGASGTLVVWSELDRCTWRTAKSIIKNSEFVIGRMYRRFIDSGDAVIRMATFSEGNPVMEQETYSLANDPIYMMQRTSTPRPFGDKAMFEKYGEGLGS